MNIFKKKQYSTILVKTNNEPGQGFKAGYEPQVPDGKWIKCPSCNTIIHCNTLSKNKVCSSCGHYYRLSAQERLSIVTDDMSFVELDANLKSGNPLEFPDYEKKLEKLQNDLDISDAVITGYCTIDEIPTCIGVMDSNFIMGSMGSAVGEKITRLFEYATEQNLPVILYTASGGARMQEGIISLMQMAKVSASIKRHSDKGLLYVTVLTDPTTGGVTASFAMLGDIILAEPKALIGFAGRRVIEQTINEQLPENFQKAELLLECGFVDKIVERENAKNTLAKILKIHTGGYNGK